MRPYLTVLGLAVREAFPGGGKLAELVANHLVGHGERSIVLAIVDLELEADEGRDDGAGTGISADRDVVGQGLLETRQGHEEGAFPCRARHLCEYVCR